MDCWPRRPASISLFVNDADSMEPAHCEIASHNTMAKKKSARPNSNRSAADPAHQSLERLKELFANPRKSDLSWYREVGRLVEQLHPRAGGREHGKSVIKNLAEQLQPGGSRDLPGRLQRMQRFAVWLDEHVAAQQLVQCQRKDGQPLTWSYVEAVLPLDGPTIRLRLLKKCLAENLTVKKLTSLVRDEMGGRDPRGGRPHAKPTSVDEALNKTASLAAEIESWCQALEPDEDAQSVKGWVTIDQLPASVGMKLRKARQALGELCQAIEAERQRPQRAKTKHKIKLPAPNKPLRGFLGRSSILGGR